MGDELQQKIMDYHELAQYHMKLAYIMYNHKQFQTALVLCNWALTSMTRALYIHQNRKNTTFKLSLTELLLLIHTDFNPGLDIVIFIGKMNYILCEEEAELEKIEQDDMDRLLRRTDEVLRNLSVRIINNTTERYQSLFSMNE